MSAWIDVCALNDLQADSGVCALVAGKQVALFYLTRTNVVYAVGNFDPIGKANVMSRGMIGDLDGEPMVASPLYKQHYSLQTGACFEYDDVKIETYAVRVDNNRVAVKIEAE
ncbi:MULTISPECIES: nitrite reductase small subunit NirD [Methylomonas]|uniref:Nitrite reductase small subunit n=2 Tax=Methylomonas TaxID=416 RepID=A0A126T3J8_9GAMM|nr:MULTISPECIES: nitrite reductase small subunit NirD [Methylomonas]AMK76632.1 nitrite reductase small subunit [Methylomonas denitrificans]OAH96288.1 nitrite reductase small subunit [Methylomonas methanica]TCV73150.1 nitrite reductase (NADH) small subunit [Methylomonas methanica]